MCMPNLALLLITVYMRTASCYCIHGWLSSRHDMYRASIPIQGARNLSIDTAVHVSWCAIVILILYLHFFSRVRPTG